METQAKLKCPKCGSENVIIQKRGYSFLGGVLWGVLFMVVLFLYTVISDGSTFASLDDTAQAGYSTWLMTLMFLVFLFGLPFGLIGKNDLVATCLKCGKKFDPKKGFVE